MPCCVTQPTERSRVRRQRAETALSSQAGLLIVFLPTLSLAVQAVDEDGFQVQTEAEKSAGQRRLVDGVVDILHE